jgi:hypothetical protein
MWYRLYGRDAISKEPRAPLDIEADTEEAAREEAAGMGMEVLQVDPAQPQTVEPSRKREGAPTRRGPLNHTVPESRRGPDIGRCFNEAVAVYTKSFLPLFLAAILLEIFSVCSLLILCGPLTGGVCLMTLGAMRREDKSARLGDLFGTFDRFGPLVGLFFLTLFLTLLGFVACLLPGLALMTIWLFPFYLMVDKGLGVFEALGASKDLVMRNGFGMNFLLAVITFAIGLGPSFLPYIGPVLAWFLAPLSWLVVTSAYLQQVAEDRPDVGDFSEAIRPAP